MNGIELLRRIREFDAAVPVIMMTAYGTIEGAVEAVKLGAFDYLKKPVDLDELKLLTDRARESSRLKQELSYYRRRDTPEVRFAEIAGQSPAIRPCSIAPDRSPRWMMCRRFSSPGKPEPARVCSRAASTPPGHAPRNRSSR